MKAGAVIVHDAFYRVGLIALYIGMLREEICGIELAGLASLMARTRQAPAVLSDAPDAAA